jgi:DNA-binding Lrp family transcriptional regulator
MKLDQKDFQILKLLQEDANITNKEIASATGLTITPVYERVKKLTSSGVIKSKTYVLDRKKLGFNLMVLISVSLNQHLKESVDNFIKEIVKNKEVVECFHLTGTFDFHLKVYVSDMDAYQDFILNKLSAINNIGHIESYFVITEIKNTTSLPIL